jgi:hypothetical protein
MSQTAKITLYPLVAQLFAIQLVVAQIVACSTTTNQTSKPAIDSAPSSTEARGSDDALVPGSFVYIGSKTRLFMAPDVSGRFFTKSPPALAKQRAHFVYLFRVVDERGEWLTVLPVNIGEDDAPTSCSGPGLALKGLAIPFFVRRTETDPVMRKDREITWPDGTRVMLNKGLHLVALDKPNLFEIRHEGISFSIFLAQNDVGRWFNGEVHHNASVTSERYLPNNEIDPDQPGPKGEKRYRPTTQRMHYGDTGTMIITQRWNSLLLSREVGTEQGLLVSWSRKCVEATVLVDAAWPRDLSGGVSGGVVGISHDHGIRKEATLFWPSTGRSSTGGSTGEKTAGSKAGTAVKGAYFHSAPTPDGKRLCFTRFLHPTHQMKPGGGSQKLKVAPEGTLVICVAPDDITDPPKSSSASQ